MRVVLCGDMLFSSRNLAKRLSPEVVKILKEADAVFCNAEFSTPKRGTPPGLCMYLTSVPQEIQDEFVDLNIHLVGFANNHTCDYGWQGCLGTIEAAEARKIQPVASEETWRMPVAPASWIAADSTWSERALACNAGADTVARPGLAPLRWGRTYVLPEEEFEQIRKIDKALGTLTA